MFESWHGGVWELLWERLRFYIPKLLRLDMVVVETWRGSVRLLALECSRLDRVVLETWYLNVWDLHLESSYVNVWDLSCKGLKTGTGSRPDKDFHWELTLTNKNEAGGTQRMILFLRIRSGGFNVCGEENSLPADKIFTTFSLSSSLSRFLPYSFPSFNLLFLCLLGYSLLTIF